MLQVTLQKPTAAAGPTTTALMSSTPSPQNMATPTSSGTQSVTVTATIREFKLLLYGHIHTIL